MIIDNYDLSMDSSGSSVSYSQKSESLVQWTGGSDARAEAYQNAVSVELSENAMASMNASEISDSAEASVTAALKKLAYSTSNIIRSAAPQKKNIQTMDENQLKLMILESLTYRITGKKAQFKLTDVFNSSSQDQAYDCQSRILAALNGGGLDISSSSDSGGTAFGWGLDYSYSEVKYQSEKVSFSSSGTVKTADGREINFDVQLNMSRELYQEKSFHLKAGDALIDPLVINLNGTSADLSDRKFEFDIDSDGQTESISGSAAGCAFLAIDKNNDGKINNGKELFGPSSNNGFRELASCDSDKNGWIDENDKAYNKIKLWSMNPDGSSQLISLKDAGIGAIYTGSAKTQFSVYGNDETLDGQLKSSGVFLKEDGSAGIVQELDLLAK